MKIFLDSVNLREIEQVLELGILGGITTNPTLIGQSASNPMQLIKQICDIASCDVSAEVFAEEYDNMISEGSALLSIADNVTLKLPVTQHGLKACQFFTQQGRKTNITLCFSANQALLAAKSGATYISPFVGRLEDTGESGINLIKDIKHIYANYPIIQTNILAASIRSTEHVLAVAKAGADAATMSFKLINQLYSHPLTDKGLEIFQKDIQRLGIPIAQ